MTEITPERLAVYDGLELALFSFEYIEALMDVNGDPEIREVYDENDRVAEALNTLIPGFEYPDWSHKTIGQALRKILA